MRVLERVETTPEQKRLLESFRLGPTVVRGAAGSGKTTVCLMRLDGMCATMASRFRRQGRTDRVRALVLTFNKTLSAYVRRLTEVSNFSPAASAVDLEVATFAQWACARSGIGRVAENECRAELRALCVEADLPYDLTFLLGELDYLTGRFPPAQLHRYISAKRDGRGSKPRVDGPRRQQILDRIVTPYQAWKTEKGLADWNDVAVATAREPGEKGYDVIVVDEAQDFSANQLRTIASHCNDAHSMTIILDTSQRIYARGYTWKELGLVIHSGHSWRLHISYRNTAQIAHFVAGLLRGLETDDDGTVADPGECNRQGPMPLALVGDLWQQLRYVRRFLRERVDLRHESAAFLHPGGGRWFEPILKMLREEGIKPAVLTKASVWPEDGDNIACCTLSSAKGLEFDHVILLDMQPRAFELGPGISTQDADMDDAEMTRLRRLLGVGFSRARQSIIFGYDPTNATRLLECLDPATYEQEYL